MSNTNNNPQNKLPKSSLAVPAAFIDRSSHEIPGMNKLTEKEILHNEQVYETVLKPLELENEHKQNISAKETFCIFSNPRGGSTWLGEILSEIPDSVFCNEPLFRLQEFSELNFTWHQPIPAGDDWPEAKAVFKKLLNREILRYNVYHTHGLLDIPNAKAHIFKFCHGNMLLEWFTEHFDVNPILLVRHPCAVVASQLKHHGWEHLKSGKEATYYIPDFRHNETYFLYEDVLKTVKTVEENLAATWCLTMVDSLKNKANDVKWITLAYENLYTNFEYEMDRVFGRLGIEIPSAVYERNRKISVSTLQYSKDYLLSGKQLSSWKDHLSLKQQQNIMGIVQAFGIDHYTLDPAPDLSKMYAQH